MPNKITLAKFIEKAKKVHGDKYGYDNIINEFKNVYDIITINCPYHGNFKQPVYRHLDGQGCINCTHIVPVTYDKFIKKSKEVHGDKYGYDNFIFIDKFTKGIVNCPVHGEFKVSPKSHMRGVGCPCCMKEIIKYKKTYTLEQFIEKARKVHGDKYGYNDAIYTNSDDKITITCYDHGNFIQEAGSHLRGHGCPKCKITSKGENKILEILNKLNIEYIKEFNFNNSKFKYDFYLPKYKLLIEYDGKQHFVENSWGGKTNLKFIKKRDKDKNKLAYEKNINIKRIPYFNFKNIEKIIKKTLIKINQGKKVFEMINDNQIDKITSKIKVILYTDGSCRGNPGYAGSGVYGYTYKDSEKPKNHKHPYHATLYFTPDGILKEKSATPIEVIDIVEVIKAIDNPTSTNNEAELLAVVTALQKAILIQDLKEVTIFTDSNYIVTSFNENMDKWKQNNWKRIDHKPIVHLKEWTIIDNINNEFISKDIKLTIKWIKGHSDSYGNNIADIYSVIGSNAARQLTDTNTLVLDQVTSYADYKKSFDNKDFIFFFRDMYFSSDKLNDANYCFLSTSEDANILGKRNNSSIFVSNIGYVPPIIARIKEFYRNIERDYISTCCIKINKLENRDIYRLTELVETKYLLIKTSNSKTYNIVGDGTPFLFENSISFPFIINASNLFNRMNYIDSVMNEQLNNIFKFDITDDFIDNNKLKLTNKDKFIDFTEKVKDSILLKQNLIIKIGYDIPSFLALKNIEDDIEKIYMVIESNIDNNFCTVYVNIITKNRSIYSVNIENKYLRKYK